MSRSTPTPTNGPASDNSPSTCPSNRLLPHICSTKPKKTNNGEKTLWVTFFKCFQCGKRGHKLPKCTQCSQAYYCNADCQRKHWKTHKPVCRAALAALARRATRERLAKAVRENGKDMVEHSADDDLCVICQDTTVDAVEVSALEVYNP